MKHIKYLLMIVMMAMLTTAVAQNNPIRTSHKVEKSETIFGIAKKYGITIEELIKANPVMNQQGYELKSGETINIPYAKG